MWIITKTGFVSIVRHENDDQYRARARVRSHLEEAFPTFAHHIEDMSLEDGPFDYQWHLDVPEEEMACFMADAIASIDYTTSFKNNVRDKKLKPLLMDCWSTLLKLQKEKPRFI